jgi:hypothetical protein
MSDHSIQTRLDRAEERERARDNLLARIEERQLAEGHEADHRYGNLKQSIQGLVTRHEHDALAERVKTAENTLKWIVRSFVGINTLIVGGLAALGKRLGVWS